MQRRCDIGFYWYYRLKLLARRARGVFRRGFRP